MMNQTLSIIESIRLVDIDNEAAVILDEVRDDGCLFVKEKSRKISFFLSEKNESGRLNEDRHLLIFLVNTNIRLF